MKRVEYPEAIRLDLVDELHGNSVPDPYRWLEDGQSEETKAWSAAQDDLFRAHRNGLPGRDRLRDRIKELISPGTVTAPVWRAKRHFFLRRTAEQEYAVLHTVDPGGSERVLIDPMEIDPSGTTTLDSWQPDKEGRLLAYQLSEKGTEESVLRIMNIETGEIVDGPIDRCRYSPIAWLPGGEAFYYVRKLPPEEVPEGEEQYHRRVYLHRVGRPADDDVLIFGEGRDKADYYSVSVSWDGRWLLLLSVRGTAPRNDAWIADLHRSSPERPELRTIQDGVDARTHPYVGRDGRLYIHTDREAPRAQLCVTDPQRPEHEFWTELVGEHGEAVLDGFAILDGSELERPILLLDWTRHAVSEITVHDAETGKQLGTVPTPGLGSISGISERPEGGHEAWFSYTDHVTPATVQHYDARTSQTTTWATAPGTVELPPIEVRQVTYSGQDGTPVRMFILARDDMETRARPTILNGYGGFGISLTPAYAGSILAWIEAGGAYAVANLRGGGEEGEGWHRAGMLGNKQNVFDDFYTAARHLVAEGWTTPDRLAIYGGSNGGLLVGAAMTQHPSQYAAVVCAAPLLDMVRYERSGLGQLWSVEYGTAEDPEQLGWLLAYSPYHRVREGGAYPATLFTTFDSDTRVDPMHARKMCAALQHATSGNRPILLRRETDVGHGARAVSRSVELSVDVLAFLAKHTNLEL